MRIQASAALVFIFPVSPLVAQVPARAVPAVLEEGLARSRVMEHLDHLTNSIGPRLTGSDAFLEAARWARDRFASWGLEAKLETWATWPRGWNRGQWSGRILEPEPLELQVATYAWTVGTRGRVRGPLFPLPRSKTKYLKVRKKMKGYWLFGPQPSKKSVYGRFFWEAVRKDGILGIVTPTRGDKKYPNRIRVFGRYRNLFLKPEQRFPYPVVHVRYDQAKEIESWMKKGKKVVAEFEIRNRFREGQVDIPNVVAEIRGTEKPDEVVIVCGHLDSWHQATGTTDNGTGVATTMEAARILAKVGAKPKRTIRFLLWGGEEQGLLGSVAYVRKHREEMKKVSAVFNHDAGTNWVHSLTVTKAMEPLMRKVFAPVMKMRPPEKFDGPVFVLKAVPKMGVGGGSDHASFRKVGVPAFPWGLTGRSDYGRYTWHSQWDTYDVAIPEYQKHSATVIALAAWGTANLPVLLPRKGLPGQPPRTAAGLRAGTRPAAGGKPPHAEKGSSDPKEGGRPESGEEKSGNPPQARKKRIERKKAVLLNASPGFSG